MKLVYAFLANNAEIGQGGRTHIFGADFNTIIAPVFPAITQFAVVAKLGFEPEEIGASHSISVELKPPDQEWIRLVDGSQVVVEKNESRPHLGTGAMCVAQLFASLATPGTYQVRVLVDDLEITLLNLYVEPMQHVEVSVE